MVIFKDINKTSSDLLTRDFVHERPWDIEFKHSAKNPVFIQNAYINGGGVFDALSSAKYNSSVGSIEVKLGTTSTILDAQYKAPYLPGLTVGSRLDRKFHSKGALDTVDLSADYLTTNGTHCRLAVNPLIPSWNLSTLACIPTSGSGTARVGAEVTGTTELRGLKYAAGLSFSQSTKDLTYTASFRTTHVNGSPLGKLTSNIHAKANKPGASEYGAEINHTLADSKTNVSFVGMWYLDQASNMGGTSNTFFKAKMSQDAHLAASLTHKFNESFTATFGAQIDASKSGTSPDSVKYGMRVNVMA